MILPCRPGRLDDGRDEGIPEMLRTLAALTQALTLKENERGVGSSAVHLGRFMRPFRNYGTVLRVGYRTDASLPERTTGSVSIHQCPDRCRRDVPWEDAGACRSYVEGGALGLPVLTPAVVLTGDQLGNK